ncbi:MAG: dTDP-glucose 4,6-dehydratase [Symploca sp. SIO3C6]|uniref:dTDP-glucose 4,6-dehydratase n=1 Tax=Symploca sp. SIO1C4 TaxID=2607765 RepID=A0A6B3NFV1_9CYAN|nr:dTDP-glucose 4,6-dehydratase [Symploca sp. SIO3C6]NER30567.1 dTDP-glucose 4,6-dehydratase [Symploca sp. SIO1C4]NET04521.1 dTDP-glucose 4,6-dehydratase [Symploca sp. SIO2B6]
MSNRQNLDRDRKTEEASSLKSRSPRRLLVTGGAGFIGSNFAHYWCKAYPDNRVVVLDALTYAGSLRNLEALDSQDGFRFVQGDICDPILVEALIKAENIDTVVHFAAESDVDRSILGPVAFVRTNVLGTSTLLETFRQCWKRRGYPESDRFIHISTDEVYGSLGADEPAFTETTPYNPNSPYSASKAGSDFLVRAYHHTYGLPTLITNCSNNYGPYQFPEKVIPLMLINMIMGKPLPVYGDGQNVRDWLYVEDHCRALDLAIHKGIPGETYNIGSSNQLKNIELIYKLCELMDKLAPKLPVRPCQDLITFVKDRPGHDRRYAMDTSKIETQLGWQPQITLEQGLHKTVKWYLKNRKWWKALLSKDYKSA